MRRGARSAQREAQERYAEVHLQGLRQDVLHHEEHDIRGYPEGPARLEGVHGVHVGGPVARQDGGALRHHSCDGVRLAAQGAGRDRRGAEGHGAYGHRRGGRGFPGRIVQGRQEGF